MLKKDFSIRNTSYRNTFSKKTNTHSKQTSNLSNRSNNSLFRLTSKVNSLALVRKVVEAWEMVAAIGVEFNE